MKKSSIHAALFAALSVSLTGCIKDSGTNGNSGTGLAVRFSTTIATTRAHDAVWEHGDFIGVYMLPAAEQAAEPGTEPAAADWTATPPHAENKKYGHNLAEGKESGEVVFSGVGDDNVIVWPEGDSPVDFVAYYPWRESGLGSYVYPVDISDQSSQKDIDLMWSNNVKGVSSGNPSLEFEHKLTKLVFNIVDMSGASLEGMTSTFDGLPTVAGFDLATGEMIADTEGYPDGVPLSFAGYLASLSDLPADEGGEGEETEEMEQEEETEQEDGIKEMAVVEAIVLPGTRSYTLTFALANGEKAIFRVDDTEYLTGKKYVYDITLKARPKETEFGEADGNLSSIKGWGDGETDGGGDITKTDGEEEEGGPSDDEPGEMWSSETLVNTSDYYTVNDDGGSVTYNNKGAVLSNGAVISILMPDEKYDGGIESVTVTAYKGMVSSGEITSVRVGGIDFEYSEGGARAAISGSTPVGLVFAALAGGVASGDVEIVVSVFSGSITVADFRLN